MGGILGVGVRPVSGVRACVRACAAPPRADEIQFVMAS